MEGRKAAPRSVADSEARHFREFGVKGWRRAERSELDLEGPRPSLAGAPKLVIYLSRGSAQVYPTFEPSILELPLP